MNYIIVLFYYEGIILWTERWSIILCQWYGMKYSWTQISSYWECNLLPLLEALVPRCTALAVYQLCPQREPLIDHPLQENGDSDYL